MQIRLCFDQDEDGATQRSLYRWLSSDADVTASSVLKLEMGERATETMGGALDVILATAGDVASLGTLLLSYVTWRDARKNSPKFYVKRGDLELTIPSTSTAEQVSAIAEQIAKGPAL